MQITEYRRSAEIVGRRLLLNLDFIAATQKNFKIEADGTGIKIIPRADLTLFFHHGNRGGADARQGGNGGGARPLRTVRNALYPAQLRRKDEIPPRDGFHNLPILRCFDRQTTYFAG